MQIKQKIALLLCVSSVCLSASSEPLNVADALRARCSGRSPDMDLPTSTYAQTYHAALKWQKAHPDLSAEEGFAQSWAHVRLLYYQSRCLGSILTQFLGLNSNLGDYTKNPQGRALMAELKHEISSLANDAEQSLRACKGRQPCADDVYNLKMGDLALVKAYHDFTASREFAEKHGVTIPLLNFLSEEQAHLLHAITQLKFSAAHN